MSIELFPIVLQETYMLSPNVKHFNFQCETSAPLAYIPGQFITLHFEHEDKSLKRSYSIANEPCGDYRIEFAAGYVENGPATNLLFNLKVGDTLQASGPYGRLILKEDDPKRYILMATSTGVTPYRAMLPLLAQRLAQQPELEVIIIQGGQKREDILYYDTFTTFCQTHERATFRAQLSRESSPDHTRHEYSGYVQTALPDLALDASRDVVYLCGNPGMVDESFNYLKDHGFSMQQIIREKYISR